MSNQKEQFLLKSVLYESQLKPFLSTHSPKNTNFNIYKINETNCKVKFVLYNIQEYGVKFQLLLRLLQWFYGINNTPLYINVKNLFSTKLKRQKLKTGFGARTSKKNKLKTSCISINLNLSSCFNKNLVSNISFLIANRGDLQDENNKHLFMESATWNYNTLSLKFSFLKSTLLTSTILAKSSTFSNEKDFIVIKFIFYDYIILYELRTLLSNLT